MLQDAAHRLERRAPGKRRTPREQLVQHRRKPVDIHGRRHRPVSRRLLRGHVRGRAERRDRPRGMGVATHELRQPEIRQERLTRSIHQDVSWLQVPVQHPAIVRVLHRTPDRGHQPCGRFRRVGRSTGIRPLRFIQLPRERTALDELHREVMLPAPLPDLVDRNDVRVLQ